MKTSSVLVLDAADGIGSFGYFLNNYPPLDFLRNQKHFGFLSISVKSKKIISYLDIEKFFLKDNGAYLYYKDKNINTDQTVHRKIGPINRIYLEFYLLPLYKHAIFSNQVVMVIEIFSAILNKQECELKMLFEDFKILKTQKIQSVHNQDFSRAADYRDKEVEAADKIKVCLKELIPDQDLNEALKYFLGHYQDLLTAKTPVAEVESA